MTKNRLLLLSAAAATAAVIALHADAPHIYAITGARIVTAAGPALPSGTVVIRGGLIDAVGDNLQLPAGAYIIDGKGSVVYPAVIDMGTSAGIDAPSSQQPQNAKTRLEVERWKRSNILRSQFEAAEHLKTDAPELAKLAAAGITTALATPPGEVVSGQSSLINVVAPPDDPQIGGVADFRGGLTILKTPVALHVAFTERPTGDSYPNSLMGVVAFVRQSFLDAQHYQLEWAHYERMKQGFARPVYDPAMLAMQPAVERKLRVAFEADSAREILRALTMAKELKLDPVITGGREANHLAADLKAMNVPVMLSLNYPTRSKALPPDADEAVRVLRERANAPKTAAALERAGILFAFQSDGLKEPKDFIKNAAKAVKEGLAADAAVRALTINAARIAGVAERLGSLEKGKIANVIVADGDIFEEKTKVKHVFIDGRLVALEALTPPRESERRGRPAGE